MRRSSLRAVRLFSPLRSYLTLPLASPTIERPLSLLLPRFYATPHASHHPTSSSDEDERAEGRKTPAWWDESYREKAERVLFGGGGGDLPRKEKEVEDRLPRTRRHGGDDGDEFEDERSDRLARALFDAALTQPDDAEEEDEEGDGDRSRGAVRLEARKTPAWWDDSYRKKAERVLFGGGGVLPRKEEEDRLPRRRRHGGDDGDEDEDERSDRLARTLLDAALTQPGDAGEEDEVGDGDHSRGAVRLEDQRSLLVGIVGAPNAGKSSLTNTMVGSKVTAVSRKTNTTTHEMLGMLTQGNTQICIFDTPGITLGVRGHPQKTDVRARVDSAWKSIDQYDLLVVIFDVHRHLTMRQDLRVVKLINYLGGEAHPTQKRVLCMNKVDLVDDKKDLLKVADEFKGLPGYDRYFMISGLKGSGVKDLVRYLTDQAVKRPWEEEPAIMSEEIMKSISLDVVREKILDYIHQEIPYVLEHRLMDWKELRDGSLRIEQHIIAQKPSQRKILVGKKGSKIGRIGVEANEELRSIFSREVHLFLQVRVARKHGA